MDIEHLRGWIGREEHAAQIAVPEPVIGLAALLDHPAVPWPPGEVPPLGHWLYFLPRTPQSQIGTDGHARRGDFLPPVDLPRRMWAGGRLDFRAPIMIGSRIERVSRIEDVIGKTGSTGPMVFVTVKHLVYCDGELATEEWQDLVYRGEATGASPSAAALSDGLQADVSRRVMPDPVALFRYSALTFNGHRIHYDRDYARNVEGYPGLVVHGPYAATLLMDLFLCETPGARVTSFSFRGRRPLFDTAPFTINLRRGNRSAEAWTEVDGRAAMTASIEWENARA